MVSISEDLTQILRLGALRFDELSVVDTRGGDVGHPLADSVPEPHVAEDRVALVRAMYRRLGIDPTKTRPSSEALLRRVRRGETLPRINTLVDRCNGCSLETQLPYGVYDLRRVAGRITLRVGRPGDQYAGIRKHVVHLAGRLALFDERGPFGNPTSDSERTMVTEATTEALVVVFAPRAVALPDLEAVLDLTAARFLDAAGGPPQGRWVLGD